LTIVALNDRLLTEARHLLDLDDWEAAEAIYAAAKDMRALKNASRADVLVIHDRLLVLAREMLEQDLEESEVVYGAAKGIRDVLKAAAAVGSNTEH
jgi:hypothetical protein